MRTKKKKKGEGSGKVRGHILPLAFGECRYQVKWYSPGDWKEGVKVVCVGGNPTAAPNGRGVMGGERKPQGGIEKKVTC